MNLCKLLCIILTICITTTSCEEAESKTKQVEGPQQFSILDSANSDNYRHYEPDVYCNEFSIAYYRSSVHGGNVYTPIYTDYKLDAPRVMTCDEYIQYKEKVANESLSRRLKDSSR